MKGIYWGGFLLFLVLMGKVHAFDFSGNMAMEVRYFPEDPAHQGQADEQGFSLSLQPEFRYKWQNNKRAFTFIPYFRQDSVDDERSHADIRELHFLAVVDNWELRAGIDKVFWGVTESQHLVDIINQTDNVDGTDGEDKLGQPMIRVSRILGNGSADFFLMPYFRERTFAGEKGRFRGALPVATDLAQYESADEERHLDYAVRLNQSQGSVDWGVSWFEGTSREPEFRQEVRNNQPVLIPFYSLIRQLGVDVQYTGDDWLWKFEAIRRFTNNGDYTASVGGFEYSFYGIADTNIDLGVLAEYHYDSRDAQATSPFQNDLFAGVRVALNDVDGSELLAGGFFDLDNDSQSFRVEASRRIGQNYKINLEGQFFSSDEPSDPLYNFRDDDFLQVELVRYF